MNDKILIIGETTGLLEVTLKKMIVDEKSSKFAQKGEEVSFITPELVRRNDKVYLVEQSQ